MKKITLICTAFLLAVLTLSDSISRGLMSWLNTPVTTKAEIAGKDGALTVTAPNTIVNKYSVLVGDAVAGSSTIAISNPGGPSGLDVGTLTPGDLLLIIQMAGAEINSSDTVQYGTVTDLKNAGRYEFVTVNRVDGNVVTINPPCGGLRYSYTASGKVQVIRVPQFTTMTINPGASITAPAWDGKSGGIVVVHVQSNAVINGTVDVSGLGFRGAQIVAAGGGGFREDYRTNQQDFGALKGEGIAGYGMELDAFGGPYGRGAAANGGGGGTSHNSGGGGGANGNNGKSWTGQGVMDGSVTGAAAWARDPGYKANGNALTDSSGGGRGGYSYSVVDADALAKDPGDPIWGGDNRRSVGGLGGRPVNQDTAGRIFIGGGGGAGAQNNDAGGAGGNAGGLIFIIANSVTGSGTLRANGLNGGNTRNEHRDGAGGGGGGGTIVVSAQSLSGVSSQANGGNGGNQSNPINPNAKEAEGPGGGGGGGFIAFTGGSMTTQVNGGAHGSTQAEALTEFPPNGATRGAAGAISTVISPLPFCQTTTDLSIIKTNNSTTIVPGAPTTYSIVVKNNGPNDIFGAPVTDILPAVFGSISWTCSATNGSSCAASNGTGNINTKVNLLKDGTATFLLTATADPSASGSVSNTARVDMPDGSVDGNPDNNSSTDTDTFTAQADLSITKTNGVSTVTAGVNTTYTVVVTNIGPSAVNSANVVDTIPVSLTGASWTCTASPGASCSVAAGTGNINTTVNLLPGSSATFTITATVVSNATGAVSNTATVTAPIRITDPNLNNNTATDTDTISASVDLSVTKTNGTTSVTPGAQTIYTIVVSNAGPSAVVDATVVDNVAANLTNATWTCTATSGSSCGAVGGNGSINTTVNLLSGGSATFKLTATVSSTETAGVSNTVSVAPPPNTTDANQNNNSATDTDTITVAADLSITKTDGATNVIAGTTTTYTIVATNNGPSAVTGATVTDTVPANLTDASWTCTASNGSSCGSAGGTGNINIPVNLLPGGTATFKLTATVAPNATGTVVNTAGIAAPNGVNDPNQGNNTSIDSNTVGSSADLSISKVVGSAIVTPGGQVSYTIEVINNGPSVANGATVTDTLPATLSNANWTCTANAGSTCVTPSGNGNINATVNLLTGGKATFSITATVSPSATGTISNIASVTPPSGTNDPNSGNNTSTATTSASPNSDLRITKSGSPGTIRAGEQITYTITVTNAGPSTATGVKVTDTLQPGIVLVSATASQGSCSGTETITCNIGTLAATAPGNSATITIKVQVPTTFTVGPLTNTAIVTSEIEDPNPGNNTSTTTTNVLPPPGAGFTRNDIDVKSTFNDACIGGGTVLTFEVKLTNSGNGKQTDNPGPEFQASLPGDLTGLGPVCSASSGKCTIGFSRVEWNGEIPAGQTVRITYNAVVRGSIKPGTRFCTDYKINYDTNSDGQNDAVTMFNDCLEANCKAPCEGPDCPNPTYEFPTGVGADSIASDIKPGSILIFPYYSSDATNTARHNTRFAITNADPTRPAYLHMFYVDGSSCSVADNFICLTPNQTTSFLASDLDPGITGYLIVLAVNRDGCPTTFNHLIGESYIKLPSGHFGRIGAEAVTAVQPPECNPAASEVTIRLDGVQYTQLGRTLAVDGIPSVSEGNNTLLIFDRIGGDLSTQATSIGSMFGLLYDDRETSYSFGINHRNCQLQTTLSSSFPRMTPRYTDVVTPGTTGWIRIGLQDEGAIVGVIMNHNTNGGVNRGGRNLHKLTLGVTSLTLPVIPAPCN